jgi:hypothetical protein
MEVDMTSLKTRGDPRKTNYWLLIPLVVSWLAALLCIPSAFYLFLWIYDHRSGFGSTVGLSAIPAGLLALAGLAAYQTSKRVLENRWVAAAVWCIVTTVLPVIGVFIAFLALFGTV